MGNSGSMFSRKQHQHLRKQRQHSIKYKYESPTPILVGDDNLMRWSKNKNDDVDVEIIFDNPRSKTRSKNTSPIRGINHRTPFMNPTGERKRTRRRLWDLFLHRNKNR